MTDKPIAVLFACNLNRVRSPMAAALLRRRLGPRGFVDSCGLEPGETVDPFAAAAMAEIGLDLADHAPKGFEALDRGAFDLLIALTPEAHARAVALASGRSLAVEHWPTEDPTSEGGARAQRMEAYRRVRDELDRRVAERFSLAPALD